MGFLSNFFGEKKVTINPFWSYARDNPFYSVAVSADGQYIVAGSKDKKIYFFSSDGKLLWSYATGDEVLKVAVSADGQYIVAGSQDKKIYFFSNDGKLLWSYTTGSFIFSIAISADGKYIAAGSWDKNVYYFSNDGNLLWKNITGDYVECVAISAGGQYIAAGSRDKKVYYFSSDGKLLWSYATEAGVLCVAVSADGQYIAVGSIEKRVYYLMRDGNMRWSYPTGDRVYSVAISADGQYIAAGSHDAKLYYLSNDGKLLRSYLTGGMVYSVAISADGQYIAAGSHDKNVYFYERDDKLLWSFATDDVVICVAVSADGQYIAAGSRDKKVYYFSRDGGTPKGSPVQIKKPTVAQTTILQPPVRQEQQRISVPLTNLQKDVKAHVAENLNNPINTNQPQIIRAYEFYAGYIRLKISVKNPTPLTIHDVILEPDVDRAILYLERHEPEDYLLENERIILGTINPNNDRTVSLYLEPIICAKEGTDVYCHVRYKDAQGKPGSFDMEPLRIQVVCPIFETKEPVNIGSLKQLIESLPSHDTKIFSVSRNLDAQTQLKIFQSVIHLHDIRHISTLRRAKNFESWYYGLTKVSHKDMVIKLGIVKDMDMIEVTAFSYDPKDLTGFLAEISRHVTEEVSKRGNVQKIFNVTIKDSVVQRTNLLNNCDMDGKCSGDVTIADSVVTGSNIG